MKLIRKHIDLINEEEKNNIDKLIENYKGTVFHETRFNIIASEVFKTDLSYFLAYKNNELVGICPCHTFKNGYVYESYSNLASYEIPYGGWIFRNDISLKELIKKMKLRLNESLIYTSKIQTNNNEDNYLIKAAQTRQNTLIINLYPSVETIFNEKLKSQLRKKIRKAQKLGITIDKITSKNIDIFLKLFSELKTKTGLKQRDNNYYKQVTNEYEKKEKSICLAAKYKNEYISALILLLNKFTTIAWIGGRKIDIPNNLYQNELLIWNSIIRAKEYGSQYFDLSGLNEDKLPHLARIKLSFTKDVYPFYSFSKKSIYFRILNRIQKILHQF